MLFTCHLIDVMCIVDEFEGVAPLDIAVDHGFVAHAVGPADVEGMAFGSWPMVIVMGSAAALLAMWSSATAASSQRLRGWNMMVKVEGLVELLLANEEVLFENNECYELLRTISRPLAR